MGERCVPSLIVINSTINKLESKVSLITTCCLRLFVVASEVMVSDTHVPSPVADPGFLKGGGARSAQQNLAPPTFYILMARAHAHHMNRTEHEHLS